MMSIIPIIPALSFSCKGLPVIHFRLLSVRFAKCLNSLPKMSR